MLTSCRWRLFLPPKWRTACALNDDGNMDPNLTLAHITHNAAVIQLHQSIAYPAKQWNRYSAILPSSTSAGTCLTAAKEIVMIAKEFLRATDGITNPQFSFCLFIAGRVLLGKSSVRLASPPPPVTDNPKSPLRPLHPTLLRRSLQRRLPPPRDRQTLERRTLHRHRRHIG